MNYFIMIPRNDIDQIIFECTTINESVCGEETAAGFHRFMYVGVDELLNPEESPFADQTFAKLATLLKAAA